MFSRACVGLYCIVEENYRLYLSEHKYKKYRHIEAWILLVLVKSSCSLVRAPWHFQAISGSQLYKPGITLLKTADTPLCKWCISVTACAMQSLHIWKEVMAIHFACRTFFKILLTSSVFIHTLSLPLIYPCSDLRLSFWTGWPKKEKENLL